MLGGWGYVFRLDHKLDKAVVLADVALENVLTGAQHSLKASTVKFDTLQHSFGLHCSSTRSLQEQGNLT